MATPDKPPFKVKALYDYQSGHEDDLEFAVDDIITVISTEGDEWYQGRLVDKNSGETKEGLFPANFVEKMAVEVPARPMRRPPPKQPEVVEQPKEETSAPEPKPVEPKEEPKEEPKQEPVIVKSPEPIKEAPKPTPQQAPPAPKAVPPPPQQQPATEAKKEKPPPPEKPSSSSFKDRLKMFNNTSAPPPVPYTPKPNTFIKKPFVAPPPRKDAYIPPPISNLPKPRRDEETALSPPPADIVRSSQEIEREEDAAPKLSVKERMEMIRKQQELAAQKMKPKPRPAHPKPQRSHDGSEAGVASPSVEEPEHHLEEEQAPPKPKRSLDIRREMPEHHDDSSSVGDAEHLSAVPRHVPHAPVAQASDFGDDEGGNDTPDQPDSSQDDAEEEEEEEEEIDEETLRKNELRIRMMKMSAAGGMGMPGMGMPGMMPFGGPMPMAAKPKPKTKKSGDSEKSRKSHDEGREEEAPITHAPPVPLPFALPPRAPPVVEKEDEIEEKSINLTEEGKEDEEVDIEDLKPTHPQGPRPMPDQKHVEERPASPRPSTADRPPPPPPPAPAAEAEKPTARPPPPPPPVIPDQSEGSISGDEMSEAPSKMTSPSLAPTTPLVIPPIPGSRPGSSAGPLSPTSPYNKRASQGYFAGQSAASPAGSTPTSPVNKRASYIPPIPQTFPAPPTPQARPPPPPPPTGAPPSQAPPIPQAAPQQDSSDDEEVTEYEADYDTDMANKVAHRDALSHTRSIPEDDDTPLPSPPPRSMPPPPPVPGSSSSRPGSARQSMDIHRGMPPPPPIPGSSSSRPGSARQSLDMPRAPPPAPPTAPPAPVPEAESPPASDDDFNPDPDYDPYRYSSPPPTNRRDSSDNPRPMTGSSRPKMSMDLPRPPPSRGTEAATSRAGRRSMDSSTPHQQSPHIAHELELTSLTPWWTEVPPLPPVLASRKGDLIIECEESTSTKRGGRVVVQKDIYILFHDYSQTIITARYSPNSSEPPSFEQRHEPPPPQPRQDQLESYSTQFGTKIHAFAASHAGKVVGAGEPHDLITAAISSLPSGTALPPIGKRAFGAVVYANLANASVQQWDEIRRGDIVTLRNCRFVGHKGGLHQKYEVSVGEGVGVVEEWDGTKKKVRVWMQGGWSDGEGGRKDKKGKGGVKEEAWRMGDLRSGEVKVWRGVGREWVGWE